jgi:hypothetical protein
VRGTDADGRPLNGRNHYTMAFAPDAMPPVDRDRGGFWSLTMYDKDYFISPTPAGVAPTSAPPRSTRGSCRWQTTGH